MAPPQPLCADVAPAQWQSTTVVLPTNVCAVAVRALGRNAAQATIRRHSASSVAEDLCGGANLHVRRCGATSRAARHRGAAPTTCADVVLAQW